MKSATISRENQFSNEFLNYKSFLESKCASDFCMFQIHVKLTKNMEIQKLIETFEKKQNINF